MQDEPPPYVASSATPSQTDSGRRLKSFYAMAYFKKQQLKSNGKWYPKSVTIGRPVDTDTVAKKLADLSSLSVGDVLSVLKLLGGVIGDYMNNGRSVKLDGVGTFYYTANAEGQGVDSPDKVGAQQITGTRVRFIPETTRDSSNKVTTRSLVSSDIFWELLDDEIPARPVPDGEDGGEEPEPGGGTTEPGGEDPLG